MIDLYAKEYDAFEYTCAHFAADVWERLTGSGLDFRSVDTARLFERVDTPADPCIAVMRRRLDGARHIGVWTAGRVWHLRESGPHRSLAAQLAADYTDVRYYICSA